MVWRRPRDTARTRGSDRRRGVYPASPDPSVQQPSSPAGPAAVGTGGSGGAQESYTGLLLGLDRSRYEVRALSLSAGSAVQRLRALGVPVEVLDETDDEVAVRELVAWLRREEIDLVHAHMFRAEVIGTRAAVAAGTAAIVATVHSSRVRSDDDIRLLASLTPSMDRLIVPSEAIARKVRAEGRDAARFAIVPNGIDLSRFSGPVRPCALRGEYGIPSSAPLLGVVARLEPEKGHRHLIDAMPAILRAVPETWLAVIGEGSEADALRDQAAALGSRVASRIVFTGRRDDVSALTSDLTLAVLPSLREAQGISLLEAMARGVPVVASAVGGIPEVVTDGVDGRLVPPGDPAALADAIVELLLDERCAFAWARRDGGRWPTASASTPRSAGSRRSTTRSSPAPACCSTGPAGPCRDRTAARRTRAAADLASNAVIAPALMRLAILRLLVLTACDPIGPPSDPSALSLQRSCGPGSHPKLRWPPRSKRSLQTPRRFSAFNSSMDHRCPSPALPWAKNSRSTGTSSLRSSVASPMLYAPVPSVSTASVTTEAPAEYCRPSSTPIAPGPQSVSLSGAIRQAQDGHDQRVDQRPADERHERREVQGPITRSDRVELEHPAERRDERLGHRIDEVDDAVAGIRDEQQQDDPEDQQRDQDPEQQGEDPPRVVERTRTRGDYPPAVATLTLLVAAAARRRAAGAAGAT